MSEPPAPLLEEVRLLAAQVRIIGIFMGVPVGAISHPLLSYCGNIKQRLKASASARAWLPRFSATWRGLSHSFMKLELLVLWAESVSVPHLYRWRIFSPEQAYG